MPKLKLIPDANGYAAPLASEEKQKKLTGAQLNQYCKGKTRDEFGALITPDQFIRRAELNKFCNINEYISRDDQGLAVLKDGKPVLTDAGDKLRKKDSKNKTIAAAARTLAIPTLVGAYAVHRLYFCQRTYNKFLPTDLTHQVKEGARSDLRLARDASAQARAVEGKPKDPASDVRAAMGTVAKMYGVSENAVGTWAIQGGVALPKEVYPRFVARKQAAAPFAGERLQSPESIARPGPRSR